VDVAKDPESIERDIERSRAQLAEMVDGIADRVSPRRVAGRGKDRAIAAVAALRSRVGALTPPAGGGSDRPAAGAGSPRPSDRAATGQDRLGDLATRGGELLSSGRATASELVRRKDPTAIAAAVAAVTLFALVLRRRRR